MRQLAAAHEYVAADNSEAADYLVGKIMGAVEQLSIFPQCGREGRVRNTGELAVVGSPYIIAYRIKSDVIQILAILHGRRRWPQRFDAR
jgi:toxin ParE1/3/4